MIPKFSLSGFYRAPRVFLSSDS